MRKIECDKCGKQLAPLRPDRYAVGIKLPTEHLSIDLCETCAHRLKSWTTNRFPVLA